MGVYCDQYVGYVVEISPLMDDLINRLNSNMKQLLGEKEFHEKYIDDYDVFSIIFNDGVGIPEELRALKVKGHYADDEPGPEDIEILTDGMCGEYNYLILIKDVDRYSENEDEPSKYVNEMLRQVPVPQDVIDRMSAVYEYLFHKKLDPKWIYLQQIAHFH